MTLPTLHLSAGFAGGAVDITDFGASDSPGITVNRGTSSLVTTGFVSDAGTYSTTLDNTNREFDSNNASSSFSPDVIPGVPLTVVANWNSTDHTLITAAADDWPQTYPFNGKHQAVDLHATDAVGFFSGCQFVDSRPAEYSGARIQAIVDASLWPGPTDIAHGDTIVGPLTYGVVSAWSHMSDVANAEMGDLYVAADGTLTFRGRGDIIAATRSSVSQATYVQTGGLNYSAVTQGSPPIVNDVTISHNDKNDQVNAQSSASINTVVGSGGFIRGPKSLNLTLPIHTATAAQQYAAWVVGLYKDPLTTFSTVTFTPSNEPGATFDLWAEVFTRELGDLVTVVLNPLHLDVNGRPALSGDVLTRQCWIRGIQFNFQSYPWSVTFTLQDASWRSNLFTWDVSVWDGANIWWF